MPWLEDRTPETTLQNAQVRWCAFALPNWGRPGYIRKSLLLQLMNVHNWCHSCTLPSTHYHSPLNPATFPGLLLAFDSPDPP